MNFLDLAVTHAFHLFASAGAVVGIVGLVAIAFTLVGYELRKRIL